jgi:hypothetical protein
MRLTLFKNEANKDTVVNLCSPHTGLAPCMVMGPRYGGSPAPVVRWRRCDQAGWTRTAWTQARGMLGLREKSVHQRLSSDA